MEKFNQMVKELKKKLGEYKINVANAYSGELGEYKNIKIKPLMEVSFSGEVIEFTIKDIIDSYNFRKVEYRRFVNLSVYDKILYSRTQLDIDIFI